MVLANSPQQAQQEALGSATVSGEVLLNGSRVPQVATLYPDDTVRTGPDGNATMRFPGKGEVQISPQSLIRFPKSPRYAAQLEYGRISQHAPAQAKDFQIRIGNFVIVPDPEGRESTAEVERLAGGPTHVRAVQGSVGVIELEGSQTSFIRAGEEVSISVDGKISGGTAPTQPTPPGPQPGAMGGGEGGGHTTAILAGVGGGAAAAVGAGVALSGGNGTQPVSPSAP